MDSDLQRKYLHDMANALAIIEGSVNRALKLLSNNHPQLTEEIDRLKKADDYCKKTIHTLRELRDHLQTPKK
jgi:hypothetical protein